MIVVDYGCPQDTFGWCQRLDARRLVCLRVRDDVAQYNRSRSRNCGASVARGPILAFVDADMRLRPTWLDLATRPIVAGRAGICCVAAHDMSRGWDRGGTCVVSAAVFHGVRGFDEAMRGWGAEDSDFYHRCGLATQGSWFAPGLLFPIRHSDGERVKYHAEKSLWASQRDNSSHLATRAIVNPLGYGRGDFEIQRGTLDVQFPVDWPASRHIHRRVRQPRLRLVR